MEDQLYYTMLRDMFKDTPLTDGVNLAGFEPTTYIARLVLNCCVITAVRVRVLFIRDCLREIPRQDRALNPQPSNSNRLAWASSCV